MNPDDLLPTVTAIVKYDLFPNYVVAKGKLMEDGGIKTSSTSYFRSRSVIKVLPESEYEAQEAKLRMIKQAYQEKERQLRIDILESAGVEFVTVK